MELYLKQNLSQVYISSVYLEVVSQTILTLFKPELRLYKNQPSKQASKQNFISDKKNSTMIKNNIF